MVDLEKLKAWRAAGVKTLSVSDGEVEHVEFFPLSPFDQAAKLTGADADDTDTENLRNRDTEVPPADANIPPAFQRLFKNGSVS